MVLLTVTPSAKTVVSRATGVSLRVRKHVKHATPFEQGVTSTRTRPYPFLRGDFENLLDTGAHGSIPKAAVAQE